MKKIIGKYKNGNTEVTMFEDGTKIRFTKDDEFEVDYPESFDFKITDYCDLGCPMCHELSTTKGKHGDFFKNGFLDTIKPYTEIACGGGNPLSHHDLDKFLIFCKDKNIFVNLTINQIHLEKETERVQKYIDNDLIRGLGISLVEVNDFLLDFCNKNNNSVLHIINGIVKEEQIDLLSNKNIKVLILGYKNFGRGVDYFNDEIAELMDMLKEKVNSMFDNFRVVSFDNLALGQLDIRSIVSSEVWKKNFMGEDGTHTMYIDLVKREFAKTSTSVERFEIKDSIEEMFDVIRV